MRGLGASFFLSGKIVTTEAKAKALRPYAERLITRARRGTLADRRMLASVLPRSSAAACLRVATDMRGYRGGYTRITKFGIRKSDAARMAVIELVSRT